MPETLPSRTFTWLGLLLLVGGLLCHLFAAQAIGGHYMAFRDHIFGFVILTVVSGLIIFALGRKFWRRRSDISVLTLGAVQAIFGVLIYVERFNV